MRPGEVIDVLPAAGQGCPCPLTAGTVWHQGLFADGSSQRSGICKPLRGVVIVKTGMISCECPHPSKVGPAEVDPRSSVMGDSSPHASDVLMTEAPGAVSGSSPGPSTDQCDGAQVHPGQGVPSSTVAPYSDHGRDELQGSPTPATLAPAAYQSRLFEEMIK